MTVLRQLVAVASLGGAAMLVGCSAPPPPAERPLGPQVPPPPELVKVERRCDATQARFALNQTMDTKALDEARDRTGADMAITTPAGQIPTPANPLRLIVEVDPTGKMVGARCG